jgi:hypothetical protein
MGIPRCDKSICSREWAFSVLREECPSLTDFDWASFTFELEGYLDEVRRLVRQLYGTA